MHKTKKKTKTVKLPKPIKVKKEKSDEDRLPQPMTHYIDDRLEMVKQIFGTLKPKTIVNLAPDFLKPKASEEIEEACLNELLCISTKRLKSIITGTRCPTDTESSDNDSDVERHEEHISLEEISSDSEIEGGASKKNKKKKTSKTVQPADTNTKKDVAKTNEANPEGGQISVLELLELQARARAIRSQLALEPVTKIEVDSDEDKRNEAAKNEKKSTKNDRKRVSSERESRDAVKISKGNGSTESTKTTENDSEKRVTKKIKIKRNYRTSSNQEKEDAPREKVSSRDEMDKEKEKEKPKEKHKESKHNRKDGKAKESEKNKKEDNAIIKDIKKEKTSRSPSPDVIPIVAEPETLLISDSSDAEDKTANKKAPSEIKENSNEKIAENSLEKETNNEMQRERKNTEPAEGELDNSAAKAKDDNAQNSSPQKTNTTEKQDEPRDQVNCSTDSDDNTQDTELNKKKSPPAETKVTNKKKDEVNDTSKKVNEESNSTNHSDDDQNDDVISLGGDLENEMNQQLENEVNAIKSPSREDRNPKKSLREPAKKPQDESQNEDVISLESSEDERSADNQSWHSRYMQSSKVSKVLAASRLGKRVRDKLKKSKRSKKEASRENSESEKEKAPPTFNSKHEDGSVEQYKELLEVRQRKSS